MFCLCTTCVLGAFQDQKGALDSSRTGVTDSCELSCWCWELNLYSLEEQPVLWTAKPSLQPLDNSFLKCINVYCPKQIKFSLFFKFFYFYFFSSLFLNGKNDWEGDFLVVSVYFPRNIEMTCLLFLWIYCNWLCFLVLYVVLII